MVKRTSDAAALVLAGLVLAVVGPLYVRHAVDLLDATEGGAVLLPWVGCSLVGLVLVVAGVMAWARGRYLPPR